MVAHAALSACCPALLSATKSLLEEGEREQTRAPLPPGANTGWHCPVADYTAPAVTEDLNAPDTLSEDPSMNQDAQPASEDQAQTEAELPVSSASTAPEEDPLALAQAEAARLKDQLLRTAADFDNFRKRMRRDVGDAERKGRDDLLKEFLPIFDNLERAGQHAESNQELTEDHWKGLVNGIELVIRQFYDTLNRLGIERVQSLGQPFDPTVHEAIQNIETADYPPGSIAAEVQSGYREGERLIRPALVVVAKAPAGEAPAS